MLLQMTSPISPSPTPTSFSRDDSVKADGQLNVAFVPVDDIPHFIA